MPSDVARRVPAWLVLVLVVGTLALVWGLARPEAEVSLAPPPVAPASTVSAPEGSGSSRTPDSDLRRIAESDLPAEAAVTMGLVRSDGPYPFDEENVVFGNRDGLLPERPRGYYREFTVETPGDHDRGPRRLVQGRAGDLFWTTDHYASFRQVEAGR